MQMLESGFALTTIALGLTQWCATGSWNIVKKITALQILN